MSIKENKIWIIDNSKFLLRKNQRWFILGIPKSFNFTRFFRLSAKEGTTKEIQDIEREMNNKMANFSNLYRDHISFPIEDLPDSMYADGVITGKLNESLSKIPPMFIVLGGFIIVTEPLMEILNSFCLGNNQISLVKLYSQKTREKLTEQNYYFINICEHHSFFSPENSDSSLSSRKFQCVVNGVTPYHPPDDVKKASKYIFFDSSLKCSVDIWHDPLIRNSIFMSENLYREISRNRITKHIPVLPCSIL